VVEKASSSRMPTSCMSLRMTSRGLELAQPSLDSSNTSRQRWEMTHKLTRKERYPECREASTPTPQHPISLQNVPHSSIQPPLSTKKKLSSAKKMTRPKKSRGWMNTESPWRNFATDSELTSMQV